MSEPTVEYEHKPGDDEAVKAFEVVRYWLECIDAVKREDKDWRDEACRAIEVYRGSRKGDYSTHAEFNIFHANIETTLPAIYNSTPVPDVRRKFGDKDPVARVVSQILERNIAFSCETYDFDETMRQVLFDGLVPGRGVARVRYLPYFSSPMEGEQEDVDEKQIVEEKPEKGEQLSYEEVSAEYVPWKRLIIGPADCWEMVPWVAFEHYLTRKELSELDEARGKDVALDVTVQGDDAKDDNQKSDTFKRAKVYEIWDKTERKVLFVATGYPQGVLLEQDDPLGLENFFPIPRPVQPISTPGDMTPVCPYTIYRGLVEELNEVTFRIKRLVKQLRVRAGYGAGGADLARLSSADDGELVPLEGLEMWMEKGVAAAIVWWPIEPITNALKELYVQRETIKQTIYEVTGISDIVRGASKASETATAQQLKAQWGSLRIQRLQGEVQRVARDLFRLKAEIISKRFAPQTMLMVSGIQLMPMEMKKALQQRFAPSTEGNATVMPPAPPPEMQKALSEPSIEEVMGVIKSDKMRAYRIDIESDSTIRADLTRKQENMTQFLAGTAQYLAAAAPAVQSGQLPADVAAEIFSAFARNFKLGKQAEDALEKMGEAAAKPQPPKVDPEVEKAKGQMALEQQKAAMQMQIEQKKLELQQMAEQQKAANEQGKLELEREIAAQEMQLKREIAVMELQLKQEQAAAEMNMKQQQASAELEANTSLKQAEVSSNHEIKRMQINSQHTLGQHKIASDGMLKQSQMKNADGEAEMPSEGPLDKLAGALVDQSQAIRDMADAVVQSNKELQAAIRAPKRAVRGPDGRVAGIETVM